MLKVKRAIKCLSVTAILLSTMSGIASAANHVSTTGQSMPQAPITAAVMQKKHVTGITRDFAKDASIPATTLHSFTDARGQWAGVLDRYDIKDMGAYYRAYYQGYVYLED
ncbi:hypothetical protein [Paenibacillus aquistagni]|uniref:hypothetical protein n=1 Tax=Paenibacillus aquistagni TaxID=1852522 RepID=UPI000B4FDC4D|nr:hypothetical protein [Paenibacillus aquistagni]